MNYERATPNDCCSAPSYPMGKWSYAVEGEDTCNVYVKCSNCGAEYRDVFRYSHTEVDPETLPTEEARP